MEAGQPFEMGMDPLGILSRMRGNDLIHSMDNKVDCLHEEKEKNGKAKLTRIEPKNFAIGDVVRITVSFVAFMNRDKSVAMNTILKALTLVDPTSQIKNNEKVMNNSLVKIPKWTVIKRRRVYDKEKMTSRGLEDMTIIEDNN
ncbi:hypothetical protein CVT25_009042 [Psilocybe cyanescens]|uniref:Uncharacterized protein n=1 Tax=Psilocybe cyanescens TaxID=93625 RepID=A0A409XCP4_PSICY|nr:hypothetical protein CVT25_009042 [Psilocybe cyanescens]